MQRWEQDLLERQKEAGERREKLNQERASPKHFSSTGKDFAPAPVHKSTSHFCQTQIQLRERQNKIFRDAEADLAASMSKQDSAIKNRELILTQQRDKYKTRNDSIEAIAHARIERVQRQEQASLDGYVRHKQRVEKQRYMAEKNRSATALENRL